MKRWLVSDLPAGIAECIRIHPVTGCWVYADGGSYPSVNYEGEWWPLHRLAYTLFVGDIPKGFSVDHVYTRGCRSAAC